MKKYYEIHVFIKTNEGYSFGVITDKDLNDNEIIEKAIVENKFEEETDWQLVDTVEEITEEEFNELFL